MGTQPQPVDRTGYTQMSCYPRVSPGLGSVRKPKLGTFHSSAMSQSWEPREDWGRS